MNARWSITPASALLDHRRISHACYRVLSALSVHANTSTGVCWPSMATLAHETGIQANHVTAHMAKLVEAGYVRKTARFRGDGSQTSNAFLVLHGLPGEGSDDLGPEGPSELDPGDASQRDPSLRLNDPLERPSEVLPLAQPPKREVACPPLGESPHGADAAKPASKPKAPPKRSRIAGDWQPSDADRAHAASKGLTAPAIDREAEKFRDHHLAKGSLMLDWRAAWRTWCRNAVDWERPKANGHSPTNGRRATYDSAAANRALLDLQI